MKKTRLHIVFIHELGHFIAHELNYELYGIGKVGAIEFVKYDLPTGVEYEGKTIPLIEKGQSTDDKLVNLPEKIAELIYGCYFQSLFTNLPLKICLDLNNINSNGYIDAKYIASGLQQFYINRERAKLYPFLHEEYFIQLKQKSKLFKSLFTINHLEYLDETDFGFTANLVKVHLITKKFRAMHKTDFNNFVHRIKEIIDWKKYNSNFK